jgi:hypothetical protein
MAELSHAAPAYRLMAALAAAALIWMLVPGAPRLAVATEPGPEVVYVARGDSFPDALAGSVLAASHNAPLVFVTPDGVPPATRAELERLQPDRIVVFGGSAAVSEVAAQQLAALTTTGTVERLSGADRFATATAIAEVLPDKVRNADLLDGLDSTDFLRVDQTAADALLLDGLPAASYTPLVALAGPLPAVTWDFEDNAFPTIGSVDIDLPDPCGEGTTRHRLLLDLTATAVATVGDASAAFSVRTRVDGVAGPSFFDVSVRGEGVDRSTVAGGTVLNDVPSGEVELRLEVPSGQKSAGNGRSIQFTVRHVLVRHLGHTCV